MTMKEAESRQANLIRATLFSLFMVSIFIGPIYRQVLSNENHLLHPWTMFSGIGTDNVRVTFYIAQPDGNLHEINRFEVMGYDDPQEAPEWLWRIEKEEGFLRVTKQLCEALGPDAEIRAHAKIAVETGWEILRNTEENLCENER